ncbi:hypothetical protein HDV05_007039 [Chytridiales sp. JEL 0842]|nr:hypothetical protein HDV05_007039 [Chytridiales sp. JEL 0842]
MQSIQETSVWSLWDTLPFELHRKILITAGPLTLLCHNLSHLIRCKNQTEYTRLLWTDAFEIDWDGDLELLPPLPKGCIGNGLLKVRSRRMYHKLCQLMPERRYPSSSIPSETMISDPEYTASQSTPRCQPLDPLCNYDILALVPLHNQWYDLLELVHSEMAHYAIRFGYLDYLKFLVEEKHMAPSSWKDMFYDEDYEGITAMEDPLRLAARCGDWDIFEYLVQQASVISSVILSVMPAVRGGNLQIVQYLHQLFPRSFTNDHYDIACYSGNLNTIKYLYEHRTEDQDFSEESLRCAVRAGSLDIVKFLFENAAFDASRTLFSTAIINRHFDVYKYLHANYPHHFSRELIFQAAMNGSLKILDHMLTLYDLDNAEVSHLILMALLESRFNVIKYIGRLTKQGRISKEVWTMNVLSLAHGKDEPEIICYIWDEFGQWYEDLLRRFFDTSERDSNYQFWISVLPFMKLTLADREAGKVVSGQGKCWDQEETLED